MIDDLLKSITTIYIVYRATDFRKQIYSLCVLVKSKFKLNPYKKEAFIFCNKKRTSIKVLCYDKNGFILAQKTLLDTNKMKFQYINYLLEELPQLEDINNEKELEKYLPWSEKLPEEIRNYEGEYKELIVN